MFRSRSIDFNKLIKEMNAFPYIEKNDMFDSFYYSMKLLYPPKENGYPYGLILSAHVDIFEELDGL